MYKFSESLHLDRCALRIRWHSQVVKSTTIKIKDPFQIYIQVLWSGTIFHYTYQHQDFTVKGLIQASPSLWHALLIFKMFCHVCLIACSLGIHTMTVSSVASSLFHPLMSFSVIAVYIYANVLVGYLHVLCCHSLLPLSWCYCERSKRRKGSKECCLLGQNTICECSA